MGEVDHRPEGMLQYFVASLPADIGHKTDTAGIVLEFRAI
jgi:hypothetical protein